jgi:hypothetical protein
MEWLESAPPFNTWILANLGRKTPEVVLITQHSPNGLGEMVHYLTSPRDHFEDYQFFLQPSLHQEIRDMCPAKHESYFHHDYSDSIKSWCVINTH